MSGDYSYHIEKHDGVDFLCVLTLNPGAGMVYIPVDHILATLAEHRQTMQDSAPLSPAELLAQVKAKINEATQRAINHAEVGMEVLFLYTSLQILEKLEAMHETLRSIESDVNATAHILTDWAHGLYDTDKKDGP